MLCPFPASPSPASRACSIARKAPPSASRVISMPPERVDSGAQNQHGLARGEVGNGPLKGTVGWRQLRGEPDELSLAGREQKLEFVRVRRETLPAHLDDVARGHSLAGHEDNPGLGRASRRAEQDQRNGEGPWPESHSGFFSCSGR